jgi:hypothetical protein
VGAASGRGSVDNLLGLGESIIASCSFACSWTGGPWRKVASFRVQESSCNDILAKMCLGLKRKTPSNVHKIYKALKLDTKILTICDMNVMGSQNLL